MEDLVDKKYLGALPDMRECSYEGKRVIVRTDLNVPVSGGIVMNDFRIRRALPTLLYLQKQGAKIVVLSHIGRDTHDTLIPVFDELKKSIPLAFVRTLEEAEQKVSMMENGEVLLLENIRQCEGEAKNDSVLSERLSKLGELFVNDAFAASHRAHASIVGIPKFLPSYAGLEFLEEVKELTKAMDPVPPSLFILGGAKFETKRPLIEHYLTIYDTLFIGGALSNDFFKAKGYEVGKSLISDNISGVQELCSNEKIMLPVDVVVKRGEGESAYDLVLRPQEVEAGDVIVDAGPETIALLLEKVHSAESILWNGPLGNYERGYRTHTEALARAVASASGLSVVGGGDTIASIASMRLEHEFSFLSTGGGAMLEFLSKGTLPGIDALLTSKRQEA